MRKFINFVKKLWSMTPWFIQGPFVLSYAIFVVPVLIVLGLLNVGPAAMYRDDVKMAHEKITWKSVWSVLVGFVYLLLFISAFPFLIILGMFNVGPMRAKKNDDYLGCDDRSYNDACDAFYDAYYDDSHHDYIDPYDGLGDWGHD